MSRVPQRPGIPPQATFATAVTNSAFHRSRPWPRPWAWPHDWSGKMQLPCQCENETRTSFGPAICEL